MEKDVSFVQRLTTSLLSNQAITQKEADSLVAMFHDRAKGRVDNFLLDEGLIERETLLKALSSVYQVPFFDVNGYFFEHDLLQIFPRDVLINKGIIPLQVDEDILIVIASDPEDPELLDIIGSSVSYDIQFNVGLRRDIVDAVEEYYKQSIAIEDVDQFDDDEEEDEMDEDMFEDEY